MAVADLSLLSWTLEGWRPYSWKLGRSREAQAHIRPDVGPLPAGVPGSVQKALLDAGLLPNWHTGLNSRSCEWVEHRHWIYETELPAGLAPVGQPVFLVAEALDYAGWILIDGEEVAEFHGVLVPHRFELTGYLKDGQAHRLALVFDLTPEEQGQIGYSSLSQHFKPRFNYSWDWCPRFVPIGIAGALRLESGIASQLRLTHIEAQLHEDLESGVILATIETESPVPSGLRLQVSLRLDAQLIAEMDAIPLTSSHTPIAWEGLTVLPWWPNGLGEPNVYELQIAAVDDQGQVRWQALRQIGFKRVAWNACEGAPATADPWVCVLNNTPVFLQGINWTPVRMAWGDVLESEYRERIELYRQMGVNLFRVWGGAQIESDLFYDLCDAAGILVWQEFPLSSSGVENLPPHDPEVIEDLCVIARSAIRRRRHHVSLLVWCGGNELADTNMLPVDEAHPCIAALAAVVEEEDPGRRFLPTSPSGPRFGAIREEYGKGLHHDVHGPWGWGGFKGMDDWRDYWDGDDALFRSEVGMPGAMDVDQIEQFRGGLSAWPPVTAYWMHTAAWWTQWERLAAAFEGLPPHEGLSAYVQRTQAEQAEAYAIAARACKQRFPRCGGFLVWMGHDCFPCPANNSILDFSGRPKPAYFSLQQVFLGAEG
jgi:beta-mannosidase